MHPTLIFQSNDAAAGAAGTMVLMIWLAALVLSILMIAANWVIFQKAGEPGWASLIPFYNLFVFLKICDKPAWWFILLLIPGVNLVVSIILVISLANNFGKDTGFALGLILLPIIFYPLLAFGDAQYQGAYR